MMYGAMNDLMKGIKMKIVLLAISLLFAFTTSFAQGDQEQELNDLHWVRAPSIGKIGDKSEFKLTGKLLFLNDIDTSKFLQINGNLPIANHYTIANGEASWFGILNFVNEGYVKDDEKIDADVLLEGLKESNKAGNEQKRQKGLPILNLEGWYFPPRYDKENKRLEWGTKLRAENDQSVTVNVTTKILGKSGYTTAILVTKPETLDKDLVDFKQALKNFDYVSGEKYGEWKQGDRVAAYGLGALVLGGAAAVAANKGFFAAILGFLAASWKFVAIAALGGLAWLKSLFTRKK